MNLFSVGLFGFGGVLVYSAVKGYNPRDVVLYGLGGPRPVSFSAQKSADQQQSDNLGKTGRSDGKPAFPDGPDAGTDGYHPGGGPTLFYTGNPTTDTPQSI